MVHGAALEKRFPIISGRGFESHPLRQPTPRLRLASQEFYGEVLEWTIRHAWRACSRLHRDVGSNPTLSASLKRSLRGAKPLFFVDSFAGRWLAVTKG